MPASPRDKPGSVSSRASEVVTEFAGWLIDIIFNKLGAVFVAITATYIAVRSFGDSEQDGIRAVICFLIPTLWGAWGLAALAGDRRPFEAAGKYSIPILGVIGGVVISVGIAADTPRWTTNLGLGVMEGFFFMIFLSREKVPSRLREPLEREWTLAMLIMVTIVSITVAVSG